ncbi:acetolactate decarboxylase [Spiroplasma kunkelii CR2-3x]|uniref:Alpha-acetolactate decarboxylase n=1 Tax=Spiroplasma kunkelii CR2-3x TaxID=273035 RepID=A0A0K2JEX6_SPIKU|nr:acetolactate decarboxylase [Spiroplasma kunkelii]ALA96998.1 acetolactate decarboxylase [Spiroplasma kunkelii CR2-3x]
MIQKFSNVYQFSTIISLAAGNFDGMIKLVTLLKQGNFGLGTFDHLDGELIVLDGVGYQFVEITHILYFWFLQFWKVNFF